MKEFLAVILSFSMLSGMTSCGVQSNKPYNHKPVKAMKAEQKQTADAELSKSVTDHSNKQANNGQTKQIALNLADQAMQAMLDSGNAFIADQEGNLVTLDEYQLAPQNYLIGLKDKNSDNNFKVLRTVLNSDGSAAEKMISLSYSLFEFKGDVKDFAPEQMTETQYKKTLELGTTAADLLKNKKNIDILVNGIRSGSDLAAAPSAMDKVMNLMFPTAYADNTDYEKALLITAIVFSSVAVVSYLVGFRVVGHLSVLGGIVFWLLYAFEKSRDYDSFWDMF